MSDRAGRRPPDRDTLDEDLDRVLAGLTPEPRRRVGLGVPLGSAIRISPTASAGISGTEDADEPEEDSDEEQDPEDDD